MFGFFYNLFLLFYFLFIAIPTGLYEYIRFDKHKKNFLKRCGYHFPIISKGDKKLVWIHAVSMGETKAIASIAKAMKEKGYIVLVSSITETGHEEAKKSIPMADLHVYLPFDFSFIIKPIVKRVAPDLVILSETDIWYSFLSAVKEEGGKVALVSGKLSDRSFKRMETFSFVAKKLLEPIDLFLVQNEEYKERFEALLKKTSLSRKVEVTGNLKFDEVYSYLSFQEKEELQHVFGIHEKDFIITAGSTHDPEEDIWLSMLPSLLEKNKAVKLILVPRHPERFLAVKEKIAQTGIPFGVYSEKSKKFGDEKIWLIDAMGLLRKLYNLSTLAYVGGTFTPKVGGHNLLEPLFYGVPTLFGPYTYTQKELEKIAIEGKGAIKVETKEQLKEKVLCLMENSSLRETYAQQGKTIIQGIQGSKDKTLAALKEVYPLQDEEITH